MKPLILITCLIFAPALLAQAEIGVLYSGSGISDGGTHSIDFTGRSPFNLSYVIENTGTTDLVVSGVSVNNESNCNVRILAMPGSPVGAGGSTTLTFQVSPIAATDYSFDLSIDNDDSDENPYTFKFKGSTSEVSNSGGGGRGGDDCSTSARTGLSFVALLGVICALGLAFRLCFGRSAL